LAASPHEAVEGYQPPDPIRWVTGNNYHCQRYKLGFPDADPGDCDGWQTSEQKGLMNFDNQYIVTFLDPYRKITQSEEIAVIRLKMPKAPEQVRFFSVCAYQGQNCVYTWDCTSNNELIHDPDAPGWVTIVFSSDEDRPPGLCDAQNQDDCQFNWMPYGSSVPVIYIRQLSANEGTFPEAPIFYFMQDPPGNDPYDSEALKDWMDDYYPQAAYCTGEQFLANRCGLTP